MAEARSPTGRQVAWVIDLNRCIGCQTTPWIREDGSVDESRRRLPGDYLESLFGPRVRRALQTLEGEISKRREGSPSELMETLIAYDWKEMLGPFTRDPAELTWS